MNGWACWRHLLGQGLTFALEQVVANLGALELALHEPQRLPGREDGFSCLGGLYQHSDVQAHCMDSPQLAQLGAATYPAARHDGEWTGREGLGGQWGQVCSKDRR